MKYSHILWDFNGTILNDVEAGIRSVNTLLMKRGLKTIDSIEYYHSVFTFPIIEYYKRIGFDFEKEDYKTIAVEWVEEYLKNAKNAPLCKGAYEALNLFSSTGKPQIILSATEKSMLENQLEHLNIKDYFAQVLGLDNIHAYSKVSLADKWMKKNNPQRALLIGDTLHDYETARAIGIECVLVARGHQSREMLLTCGVPVFNELSEVTGYILNE